MNFKKGIIIKYQTLSKNIFELSLKTEKKFSFKAGQFITIKINDGKPAQCFRAYSIASAPRSDNTFELCIKTIPGGRGSNWLNSLREGDEIQFIGPNGEFLFKTPKQKNALFVATGTGIAALKCLIEDELKKKNNQKMHLLWGLRFKKDIFYKEFLENFTKIHKNFTFEIVISNPQKNWTGKTGWVTNVLRNMKIDPKNTESYLCGLTEMIINVEKILKQKGFRDDTIHFERYD